MFHGLSFSIGWKELSTIVSCCCRLWLWIGYSSRCWQNVHWRSYRLNNHMRTKTELRTICHQRIDYECTSMKWNSFSYILSLFSLFGCCFFFLRVQVVQIVSLYWTCIARILPLTFVLMRFSSLNVFNMIFVVLFLRKAVFQMQSTSVYLILHTILSDELILNFF